MEDDINKDEELNDIFNSENENNQTLNLSKLKDKINLTFDYEVNSIKLDNNDNMNCKVYYYDETKKNFRVLNYNSFNDKLRPLPKIIPSKDPKKAKYNTSEFDQEFEELEESFEGNEKIKKANLIKRLVSKQKRRFQDSDFDLDMSYITEKVIAMGFPSTGVERMYRNSLSDVIKFFHTRHNDQVKIYNLCLEKDRIYNKNIFPNSKVGLFPATDHNPCPIKLILEFCIDICLYLTKNPNGVAAVHCKAGKGRTGVMICSYLIFSGLCKSSEKAFRYYARIRTKNNTGVTIPSQKRYIKYFETFLEANFCPPYIYLIPKIIKSHFTHLMIDNGRVQVKNILESFEKEKSYFISSNTFKLKGIKLGKLPKNKELKLKICNFVDNDFKLPNKNLIESKNVDSDGNTFYEQYFNPELIIHSDIRITIKKDINFYIWVNLWYSTWEMIKNFYDKEEANFNIGVKSMKDLNVDIKDDKVNVSESKTNNYNKINMFQNDSNDNNNIISKTVGTSLYEIIYKLKHNTDLNELINRINSNSNLTHKFDKNNMEIKLKSYEFDKFQEIKEYSNLEMSIFYSLFDK